MEDVALALIEAKADIEAITEDVFVIANWDSGGRTPLHLAAEVGQQ